MTSPVISVRGLGKRYKLGRVKPQDTLRDQIAYAAKSLFRRAPGAGKPRERPHPKQETFWALQDISFDVHDREVLGVIGHNGAGKSTLLKILSQITEPTTGEVRVRGRVSSLLEVGTGFHPELSGRENVYLNGAILGMSKSEIKSKFDEIVAFSEVERFLDTPVKRYSSGMYVRLAFAVAAHLDPEILIVDEVLAVGDVDFQRKCLGKMQSAASQEGRTVLFVSHTMSAIRRLCTPRIVLQEGRIIADGRPDEVIGKYLDKGLNATEFTEFQFQATHPDVRLVQANLSRSHLRYGDDLTIDLTLESKGDLLVGIECALRDQTQSPLAYYGTGTLAGYEIKLRPGANRVAIRYPSLPLAQGRYTVDLGIARTCQYFYILAENAVSFSVDESRPLDAGYWFAQGRGAIYLPCSVESDHEVIHMDAR